jgi:hypothetical protein
MSIIFAYLPLMVGTPKGDWYVIPLLIFNGMVQGGVAVYLIIKEL